VQVDLLSRVHVVTDGDGNTATFTYDPLDRITEIDYVNQDGTKHATILYKYDDNGNVLKVIDNTGTTTFKYDGDNRIKQKTLPDGTTIVTSYDPVGNLKTYTDGRGTVTYSYTLVNLVQSITEPDNSQTSFSYYNNNQRQAETLPNGVVVTYAYDKAGHLKSIVAQANGTTLTSYQYSYQNPTTGAWSNLLQTEDLFDVLKQEAFHRVYSYDSLSRLTQVNVYPLNSQTLVEQWTYGYDAAGNRTAATRLSTHESIAYHYDYGANELSPMVVNGTQKTTYSYDADGNLMSSSPGQSYTYNIKNQTTAIGSDNYTYSGATQDERVQVNSTSYVYSLLGLSSQTDSSGTTYYTRCSCSQLLDEVKPDGSKYYYLFDGLGSVIGMTNSSGSLVNFYDYDPYGQILGQMEQNGLNNPWKYVSGFSEADTGLTKFGTRYDDPNLGRWTQLDPVGSSVFDLNGSNRYVYAGDDPVNKTDTSGAYSAYCIGSVFYNLLGAIGAGFAAGYLGNYAVGLIAAAVNLDASTASIGAALLAGFGAVGGLVLLILLAASVGFAAYYLFTNIQRDCAGT
jgi:RHS repeat-associated protein